MKKVFLKKDNYVVEGNVAETYFHVLNYLLSDAKQSDSVLRSLIRNMKDRHFYRDKLEKHVKVSEELQDMVWILENMPIERFVYECIEPYFDNHNDIKY